MNQQVKLGVRQINSNEILSLKGIMEMSFTNSGRDMLLIVNGVATLLKNGAQISLPSGSGRVYANSEIELIEPELKLINKTLYKHPSVNGGEYTADKSVVYPQAYIDNLNIINTNPTTITTEKANRNSFLRANHAGEFPSILGPENPLYNIWVNPLEFGLTSNFNLYVRWNHYKNGYAMPMAMPAPPLGGEVTWVKDWFRSLNYEKLAFLRNELENTSAVYDTIIKVLTAANEVAAFDAQVGTSITALIAYAAQLETDLGIMNTTISNLETELNTAIVNNNQWDSEVTTVTKQYVIEADEQGQPQEVEYDPNANALPINVNIMYTIEEQ